MVEENFIRIARHEREYPIYRFTTIDRLRGMLERTRNTLVSPREWGDPFENALAKSIRCERPDGSTSPYTLRNRAYGQCWTLTPETDAFWRIYLPHGHGVRLRSTINRLYQTLKLSQDAYSLMSCFIGRVMYKTEAEILSLFRDEKWVKSHFYARGGRGHVDTLLLKRTEFEHEREVRLIFLDPHNKDYGPLFHYGIDPTSLILGVTFDPRMDEVIYQTYTSVLRTIGFKGDIDKSTLYRAPEIEISIPCS